MRPMQMLRPQSYRDRHIRVRLEARGRQRKPRAVAEDDGATLGAVFHAARNKVHRRGADKARDEQRRRLIVDILGRTDLLDAAVMHQHNPIGQRHRFHLIVRDINRGGAHALAQLLDLGAHLHAEPRIEVGQRLVEQEHLGLADDCTPHRHALPLAARQLPRLAIEQGFDVENGGGLRHPARDIGLADAAVLQ